MLIGIISDTHDDVINIKKAVDFFNKMKVGHVLHAGDIISPFNFEIFRELKSPFVAVFGNNDGDKLLLKLKSNRTVHNQPFITTIHKRKIVVVHEPDLVDALGESGRFDLVIYGHTHKPDIRKMGKTIIVNPGKASKLLRGKATVAVLDLNTMDVKISELK